MAKRKTPVRRAPSEDRLIFRFWDGMRERGVDPLEVQARLTDVPDFDLEVDCKLASTATPEAPKALARVIAAVRSAFSVTPFVEDVNGRQTGLTNGECIRLLLDFAAFIDDLKKKLGISPISLAPTDCPEILVMPNSSEFSPTATEPSSNKVSPLLPESALHSQEKVLEAGI